MNSFKPGDWVNIPSLNTEPAQYRSDLCHLGLELWHPKVGEWCWFWNKEIDVPILSKLSDITNYEDLPTIYYSEHPMYIKLGEDDNYEIVESYNFNNCEPFIGQLPTFIKDQS